MIQRAIAPKARGETVRQRVYLELRRAMEQGTFKPGTRLPASREQARTLGVSRNSVLWAMERLQSEGYVLARVGDGSYMADDLGALHPSARQPSPQRPARAALHPPISASLSQRGQLIADTVLRWNPPLQAAVPFRIGAPEVVTFPFGVWDRLARQVSKAQRMAQAQYLDPAGAPALREAIAQWLWASRGIRCEAAQVLVCSGSQQAIDLIGRLLLDVGDEALVEDPGYPGIRASLAGHGVTVRPVPVDDEGFVVEQAATRWPAARLAVVTPTSQFPTGVRMSLKRRLALLDWANAQQGWVVEDDYDGEFQYGPHRLPVLCSLPHAERVLYVGTFSKTLHPGLRLGFIVLPLALTSAFAMARALSDRHAPGDTQEVLARFITEGHLLRHLRRMRELYPQRQQVLIEALAQASRGKLVLQASEQGLHLLHELPAGADDQSLSARAQAAGILLAPLSRYCIESKRRGWLFGYAGYDTAALRDAATKLARILEN
ncbi:HTH-type transcriptional regulatory protein GabR [Rhodoferax lithotrophicus]|uniref:HTH-type transcriptional regulatory protein GabR n=1 Tax=Rhodoferax lithotrophicus TaxID=2798804 RepID=A0ABM7MPK2_9BURK|nr:PLP-dependent aminotransferase family protein [Rhodoferax sp. MIZ03]BCO28247.1 HTH-type transcriptional regulatory protein GabR [Rhodoferax sp. MIZ03]